MNLSGPRQKFCEGVVSGLTSAEAYRAAYPSSGPDNARKNSALLMKSAGIVSEVARLRTVAEKEAGSAVMTLLEKRLLLAAIIEAPNGMFRGCKVTTSDRIAAIKLDNDLAGDGGSGRDSLVIVVKIGGADTASLN